MNRSNENYPQSRRRTTFGRKLLITGMAVAMSFGSVQTASAGPAIDEFIHTIECIGLLITDEEKHLAECGTNDNVAGPSIEFPIGNIAPPPPPPPLPDCDSGQVIVNGVCVTVTSPE